MKQKTLRSLTAVTLVLCLLFSTCCFVFAADERMIAYTSTSFVRDSNTKGTVSVIATSSIPDTPYVKSKITLQEAPLGTDDFTDSNVAPKTKTSDSFSIGHVVSFTITTTKEYRVKIELTDNVNGTEMTTILYEYLQE